MIDSQRGAELTVIIPHPTNVRGKIALITEKVSNDVLF